MSALLFRRAALVAGCDSVTQLCVATAGVLVEKCARFPLRLVAVWG